MKQRGNVSYCEKHWTGSSKDKAVGKIMTESWSKLQNGTDIRGIAIGTEKQSANLTPEVVKAIGYAFKTWLVEVKKVPPAACTVAVGMDSRLSGPTLKKALIEGLTGAGCDVYDCGMSTTPAMFMTTILENYRCAGAIMLTASHLPYQHNGLKLFTKDGGCEKEDIKSILQTAATAVVTQQDKTGSVTARTLIEDYAQVLVEIIRSGVNSKENYEQPLAGAKIIVDAGNGAGGFFADKVLRKLGAETTGSQFLEPDGTFPNHIPNPENKEAMDSIKTAVLANKADLGIIFDTDVDRAAVVSADGAEINRNALIALLSAIILAEHPGTTIVTDSITSTGLADFIAEIGGKHHRFKRGYKNVINESKRLNAEGQPSYLAIETSGHAACKENYFLDDGAYLVAKILIKVAQLRQAGKEIQSLITGLKMPAEDAEFRIHINDSDFKAAGSAILDNFQQQIAKMPGWGIVPDNYEGIRVSVDGNSGWFLLRLSLHEPLMVLNIESDVTGGVRKIADVLSGLLKQYAALRADDVAKLTA